MTPKMRQLSWCICAFLLSACDTVPPAAPVVAPPPVRPPVTVCPTTVAALEPDPALESLNQLLAYQASLRQLSAADLARALVDANRQTVTGKVLVRRTMLIIAQRNSADLAKAQSMLDSLLQSDQEEDQFLKPLARTLAGNIADLRRQDDALVRLAAHLRDAQRRNELLNDKLEALKNIERTLSTRPPLPPPPPGASNATTGVK
jgi:hypothetical protein